MTLLLIPQTSPMFPANFIFSAALNLAHRLGIFAFIIVGLLDQSVIPLPGSMDALLIFYVASRPERWWYYVIWATVGTTIGGFVTYRIAKKGGKAALEKKIGKKRAEKAYKVFDRWGSWSIFVSAILPPPVPIVPFLATAGVMQYPKKWFVTAHAAGRLVRFGALALITKHYGKSIFGFFTRYYKPAIYALIVLSVIGGIFAIRFYLQLRRKKKAEDAGRTPEREAA
jgi:membrane protein YqaA with SNARE-associated domain